MTSTANEGQTEDARVKALKGELAFAQAEAATWRETAHATHAVALGTMLGELYAALGYDPDTAKEGPVEHASQIRADLGAAMEHLGLARELREAADKERDRARAQRDEARGGAERHAAEAESLKAGLRALADVRDEGAAETHRWRDRALAAEAKLNGAHQSVETMRQHLAMFERFGANERQALAAALNPTPKDFSVDVRATHDDLMRAAREWREGVAEREREMDRLRGLIAQVEDERDAVFAVGLGIEAERVRTAADLAAIEALVTRHLEPLIDKEERGPAERVIVTAASDLQHTRALRGERDDLVVQLGAKTREVEIARAERDAARHTADDIVRFAEADLVKARAERDLAVSFAVRGWRDARRWHEAATVRADIAARLRDVIDPEGHWNPDGLIERVRALQDQAEAADEDRRSADMAIANVQRERNEALAQLRARTDCGAPTGCGECVACLRGEVETLGEAAAVAEGDAQRWQKAAEQSLAEVAHLKAKRSTSDAERDVARATLQRVVALCQAELEHVPSMLSTATRSLAWVLLREVSPETAQRLGDSGAEVKAEGPTPVLCEAGGPGGQGLVTKYRITKADGTPVDPDARYFVLRYDRPGPWGDACREALGHLAGRIRAFMPELARDLDAIEGKPSGYPPSGAPDPEPVAEPVEAPRVTEAQPDPGEGWRLLGPLEVIEEGDEWRFSSEKEWKAEKSRSVLGGTVAREHSRYRHVIGAVLLYRRRIAAPAPATEPRFEHVVEERGTRFVIVRREVTT